MIYLFISSYDLSFLGYYEWYPIVSYQINDILLQQSRPFFCNRNKKRSRPAGIAVVNALQLQSLSYRQLQLQKDDVIGLSMGPAWSPHGPLRGEYAADCAATVRRGAPAPTQGLPINTSKHAKRSLVQNCPGWCWWWWWWWWWYGWWWRWIDYIDIWYGMSFINCCDVIWYSQQWWEYIPVIKPWSIYVSVCLYLNDDCILIYPWYTHMGDF